MQLGGPLGRSPVLQREITSARFMISKRPLPMNTSSGRYGHSAVSDPRNLTVGFQSVPAAQTEKSSTRHPRSASDCKLPADKCIVYVGSRHKADIAPLIKLTFIVQGQGRCAAL